jgi:hypothetical protein
MFISVISVLHTPPLPAFAPALFEQADALDDHALFDGLRHVVIVSAATLTAVSASISTPV